MVTFQTTVVTPSATYIGRKEYTFEGQGPVYTFRGIRYAQAPVGKLRFAKPQPLQGNMGTVNSVAFGMLYTYII